MYDPDKHIVELAESMDSVVLRLEGQGFKLDEIVEKSQMPMDFVRTVLQIQKTV